MRLRLKHVEFDCHNIIIMREAKGNVSTTMIYTHVIKATSGGAASPLDALMGAAALA